MVWSSNCNTVAPIAHAVIIARWGVSWWTVSPGMSAVLSSSAVRGGRMLTRGGHRQTRHPCPRQRSKQGSTRRSRKATEHHRDSYALRAERHFLSPWLSVALGDLRVEPCFAAAAERRTNPRAAASRNG